MLHVQKQAHHDGALSCTRGRPRAGRSPSWRMQLAASLLTGTRLPLTVIAERVGYGSEAALSRAFERLVGVAPSAWREGQRPAPAFVAPDDTAAASGTAALADA
jgi:hypothetical protein